MTPTIIIVYQIISLALVVFLARKNRGQPTFRRGLMGIIQLGLWSALIAAAAYLPTFSHWLVVQLLAWTIFLHLPLYLLGTALLTRTSRPVLAVSGVFLAVIIISTAAYAFLIEPYNLEVRRYTLISEKISRPVKIGVIADLQTDNPGNYEESVLKILMDEHPDLILFPGDYVQDNDPKKFAALQSRLNKMLISIDISAPLGAFAVEGDQEMKHTATWELAFNNTQIKTYSQTTTFETGELVVTALSFNDSTELDSTIPSTKKFHIVTGHRPDFALTPFEADLLIAGHTHGGQVQLPMIGPIMTASGVPRSWADGLTQINPERTLIVSRGIGMERDDAPRLRFLCRPEITLIELLPQQPTH